MTPLLVALGAAVGAAVRYLASRHLDGRLHEGTLAVNVAGSFVLGWVVGAGAGTDTMALLGTGFCGGLTTYSAFAVQTVALPSSRRTTYVVVTVLGSLAAAALGMLAAA